MAKKQLIISHHLDQVLALERTKQLLGRLAAAHSDQVSITREAWNGNSCIFQISASGMFISGTIKVQPTNVEISCDLPFLAAAFWGQIQSVILDAARQLLS